MEGISIKTKINLTTKRKTAYFKYLLNYCLHKWVHPNNCWKPKNISKKKKKIKAKQEKQKIRKKKLYKSANVISGNSQSEDISTLNRGWISRFLIRKISTSSLFQGLQNMLKKFQIFGLMTMYLFVTAKECTTPLIFVRSYFSKFNHYNFPHNIIHYIIH